MYVEPDTRVFRSDCPGWTSLALVNMVRSEVDMFRISTNILFENWLQRMGDGL